MMTPILAAAGFVAGILASALFSGLETGTYVLNKIRLDLRCAKGDRQALRLRRALDRSGAMLAALLVATNAAHYWVTALAVLLLTRSGVGNAEGITTLIVTPTMFVLGEIVPKNLFRVAGETLTYRLSGVLAVLTALCSWTDLAAVLSAVSGVAVRLMPGKPPDDATVLEPRRRVHHILSEGYAHGVLSGYQSQVAQRVVALLESRLRERDRLKVERMQRFGPLVHELSESEDGLALLTMLLDDYYQETLHAPPQPTDGPPEEPRRDGGQPQRRSSSSRRSGRRRRK